MKTWWKAEPTLILNVVSLGVALAMGFGLKLKPEQQALIQSLVIAVLALINRSQVTSGATLQALAPQDLAAAQRATPPVKEVVRKLPVVLLGLLWAAPLGAQPITPPIPIHGHPQLKEYSDQSQLPTIAGHMNWAPGENPPSPATPGGAFDIVAGTLGNRQLGHGHMSLIKCPLYAELKGPVSCRFQILLFNVQATAIVNPAFQDGIRDIVWDATGSGTPPDMVGALGEEKTWNGTFVIDPGISQRFKTVHGWWNPTFSAEFRFANGDKVEKVLYGSFYVLTNPAAPETAGVPFVSIRVSPHSARLNEEWGEQDVETLRDTIQYLPLAPISAPYTMRINTAGYGATGLPPAISEVRVDADIHHHMGGKVVQELIKEKTHELNVVLDPVSLGPGTHKTIVGRRQIGLSGVEAVVTQLVFDAKVGAAPPPATVTVPNVVGQMRTMAVQNLMAVGIIVDMNGITQQDSTLPTDTVISQNPVAGAVVAAGSSATLVVSRQIVPPPFVIPDGVHTYNCTAGTCIYTFTKKP